jgi:NADP-dependent alcohol dehydrogenase
MQNFVFYNPTRIHFGKGRIKAIAREIAKDANVLITYGGGSIKLNGVLDEVKQALEGYRQNTSCGFAGYAQDTLGRQTSKALTVWGACLGHHSGR